jgi:inward rectifier potassium channel
MKSLFKVERKNLPRGARSDIYHDLLAMRWARSLALFLTVILLINSLFATLYWLEPGAIQNSDGSWASAFFFSVQTLGTIGYGYLAPASNYANILVTIQSMAGLVILAILTGFFFTKFSRPTARIDFTDKILVTDFDGQRVLMFRIVNTRSNQIIDTRIHLTGMKRVTTAEGRPFLRFIDLKLLRNHSPIIAISMTVLHVIDETSPLYGMDEAAMRTCQMEFLVTTIGTDSTFGQTIHEIHTYRTEDMVWNRTFADMLTFGEAGLRIVDHAKFNLLAD